MDRIRQWLEQPDTMGTEAVGFLPGLIARYPYCAAYRLLYVIALANVHSTLMPDELRRAAAWLPDRMRLFLLVNKGEYEWQNLMERLGQLQREAGHEENDFVLIERFLEQLRFEGIDPAVPTGAEAEAEAEEELMPLTSPTAATMPYAVTAAEYDLSALEAAAPCADDTDDVGATAGEPDETEGLIDTFLQAEAEGRLFVPPAPKPERADADEPPLNLEIIRETAFLTESLAKIYIKQHKYEQALAIIRDLNLKYPKKNTYFADQIRFLETILRYRQDVAESGDGHTKSGK